MANRDLGRLAAPPLTGTADDKAFVIVEHAPLNQPHSRADSGSVIGRLWRRGLAACADGRQSECEFVFAEDAGTREGREAGCEEHCD
jgi:hypothetical protein